MFEMFLVMVTVGSTVLAAPVALVLLVEKDMPFALVLFKYFPGTLPYSTLVRLIIAVIGFGIAFKGATIGAFYLNTAMISVYLMLFWISAMTPINNRITYFKADSYRQTRIGYFDEKQIIEIGRYLQILNMNWNLIIENLEIYFHQGVTLLLSVLFLYVIISYSDKINVSIKLVTYIVILLGLIIVYVVEYCKTYFASLVTESSKKFLVKMRLPQRPRGNVNLMKINSIRVMDLKGGYSFYLIKRSTFLTFMSTSSDLTLTMLLT